MEQWEYMSVTVSGRLVFRTASGIAKAREQLVATLNEWGEQGWELAHVISSVAYGQETGDYCAIFKRRMPKGRIPKREKLIGKYRAPRSAAFRAEA